jgi:hypothetical protein
VDLVARLIFQRIPARFRKDFTRTYQSVSALRRKLPKPRRFDLFETLDRQARAVERRREMWERRHQRRRAQEAGDKLTVAKCLDYFREGRAAVWPNFIFVLRRFETDEAHPRQPATARDYDVSTWHGWSKLSNADRRLVRRMAAKFLCEAPVPPRILGTLYTYDEAAVRAIVLLGKSITTDRVLRAVVKKKWILAILHGLYNGEPELNAASVLAYRMDRRACLAWADEELVYRDSKDSEHTSLRRFKQCWDDSLTAVVTAFARKSQRPCTVLRVFTLLSEVAPNAARIFWRNSDRTIRRKRFGKCERMIVFLGLLAFPRDGWDTGITRLRRASRAIQIRFFAEHAGLLDYDFRGWPAALTEHQLADLYLLLVDLFPPQTLKDYSRGGSVQPRDHIGDMQRACMNVLVQRGTAKACAELRRVSESVPPDDRLWVRWRLREAIDQRLRTEWTRDQPTPAAILRMARTASAIRVRDAGELQDAIVASLTRLQAAMHVGTFPKVRAFWREPGRIAQEEPEVSRNLAEWFGADLRGDAGIVTDREPQIGWKGHFDLKVEIAASSAARRPRLVVVIEVKRCLHASVETACDTQLAEGYLRRKGLTRGIYVVAWFGVPTSKVRWLTHEAAQIDLARWAAVASIPPIEVCGFALDCRWRGMEAPSGLAAKMQR